MSRSAAVTGVQDGAPFPRFPGLLITATHRVILWRLRWSSDPSPPLCRMLPKTGKISDMAPDAFTSPGCSGWKGSLFFLPSLFGIQVMPFPL
ncbi:hypothetical protein GDO78_021919 [Eleutherodactylus coqui]|uniref:Uncharacterized protein n=1 Tax=Eleutherodactylus coqui TaxID=57060 RepID=A0A8J6EGS9_ELECQ|nr:hypothetical protein GDO78_021919 [Eleutherodactylus coqui]